MSERVRASLFTLGGGGTCVDRGADADVAVACRVKCNCSVTVVDGHSNAPFAHRQEGRASHEPLRAVQNVDSYVWYWPR
jgi:hypothetical protein